MNGDDGWDGTTERRNIDTRREYDFTRGGPLSELYHRISTSEVKIDKIDDKVDNLTVGYASLKVEMTSIAKDEGKLSGIIYGVGGAIITAIIIKLVENGLGS